MSFASHPDAEKRLFFAPIASISPNLKIHIFKFEFYLQCREIGYEIHEEVLKVLHELHTAMKTHHTYQAEFRQAENKLQVVEKQRNKLRQTVPPEKQGKHRKLKIIEKEWAKRKGKYDDARLKATKARNEYLLSMDAANSSIQKYFVDDLSDLIDCMDFGFHQSVARAVLMHVSALDQQRRALQQSVDGANRCLGALDSRKDKQRFIEHNNTTFMIPKKFEYTPVRRDEVSGCRSRSLACLCKHGRGSFPSRLSLQRDICGASSFLPTPTMSKHR